MNYFNFKNALIKKNVINEGYKYTVTVDGKDISAGTVQGLIEVLNEIYRLPKADILDEIFGEDFDWCGIDPKSYSGKIKAAANIEAFGKGAIKNYKGLCFEGLDDTNSVALKKSTYDGDPGDVTLQYAIEGIDTDWNELAYDTPITLSKGQKMYVRNVGDNDTFDGGGLNYNYFGLTGEISLSGNMQSLTVHTGYDGFLKNINAPKLRKLFIGATALKSVKDLNLGAKNCTQECYCYMFAECTNLIDSPKMPAMNLATSCYMLMFQGCSNLTTAPELPATTLATDCYNSMFDSCISLEKAPVLQAKELTLRCYSWMFYGCSSLNYIKADFINMPDTDPEQPTYETTYNWVDGVAANGVFVKNPEATWDVTGTTGVPSGWTVVTE